MGEYDDIINMPHHQSKKRPHMSIYDRAAQFSAFAALTGFDDAVDDTTKRQQENIMLGHGVTYESLANEMDYYIPTDED